MSDIKKSKKKKKRLTIPSASKDVEQPNSSTLLVEMESGTATLETSVAVFMKLDIYLPRDTAIPFLCIYEREWKLTSHRLGMWRTRGGGMQWLKKNRRIFWGDKTLSYLGYIGGYTIVGICQIHRAEHKKGMTFTIDGTKKIYLCNN